MLSKDHKAIALALLTVGFWSTASSAFKIALAELSVIQLLFIASCSSTFALLVSIVVSRRWDALYPNSWKEVLTSTLQAVLNPVAYYLVLFEAYDRLPAQLAQPLNYTWPLVLVFLSSIILKQKISIKSYVALVVSFTGVLIISSQGKLQFGENTDLLGVGLASGSALIWAVFWLINVQDKRPELKKLFHSFLIGSIVILALLLLQNEPWTAHPKQILAGVYVGLFEMGFAFVSWLMAMQLASSTDKISNLVFLSPFLALFFISKILGESILPSTIVGLVVIICGIVIQKASFPQKSK